MRSTSGWGHSRQGRDQQQLPPCRLCPESAPRRIKRGGTNRPSIVGVLTTPPALPLLPACESEMRMPCESARGCLQSRRQTRRQRCAPSVCSISSPRVPPAHGSRLRHAPRLRGFHGRCRCLTVACPCRDSAPVRRKSPAARDCRVDRQNLDSTDASAYFRPTNCVALLL
jgi:hypothetical protein